MSNLKHGPKVRCLTQNETLATLESWKNNVLYGLRLNPDFKPYLHETCIFGRKTRNKPNRDLADDIKVEVINDQDVTTVLKAKEDKSVEVDWLLDQVANYAPNIPRNDITKDSKSLNEVWQKIRQYYNKQQAGSLLNDVWNVKREIEETPQALFGRMKQLYDDNLLTTDGLQYVEGRVDEDEELSPTLHNTIILHWLQVLHPELRDRITQRFITQLRDSTYAAIFPEISRSVDSLLEELSNGASACRTFPNRPFSSQFRTSFERKPAYVKPSYPSNYSKKKNCEFCKVTGKRAYYTHNIEECLFIKKINSNDAASAKQVEGDESSYDNLEQHYEEFYDLTEDSKTARHIEHIINRVDIDASPVLILTKDDEPCTVTLDTGATCNVVSEETARRMGATILPTSQKVRMADGRSNLEVVGETEVTLYRNSKPFHLSAIVCRYTDTEILAGMPFMKINDIAVRPYSDEVIINGSEFVKYNPHRKSARAIRRITVHSEKYQVLLPGQSAEFQVSGFSGDVAIEPRWDSFCNRKTFKESMMWPKPQILPIVNGQISLSNASTEPVIVRRLEHICNVQPETTLPICQSGSLSDKVVLAPTLPKTAKRSEYFTNISLNPDNLLSKLEEESFKEILSTYNEVFNPVITRYNGRSGSCYVEVNMGTNKPIQRKGRLPFYGRNDLVELQNKFDDLLANGILSRPQDIGVTVENINPSFLVKKQPPSTDKRLVTDFSSIADYCRPTPSLMPDVDTTLRSIASWRFLIKTDMSSAYHQIPMKKDSKKFCGVHTPYRGLLVYNVGCMGLPGVEVALEELTCLILGEMVMQGKVAKLADDLFIGGNTPQELKNNFHLVLQKLLENDIKLSSAKTIIAPKSVTILGWIWSTGQLKASPHRLNALSTCQQPETVSALRSYLGAYRFLSRVLKGYAKLLAPLESATHGKISKDKIIWSDDLSAAFKKSQEALLDAKTITMPWPSDLLSIVTDASVRPGAIGATLYVVRDGKPLLAGFYNSKLPEFQTRWLPCELEGLAIAAALNHFAPLIIQSEKKPQVLTDSKPCVQAIQKLCRGEFSASARLSSFLSTVSRYQAKVLHIPGASNLPSDYASRHPLKCNSKACTICKFVAESMEEVVQSVSVDDVIEGRSRIPFTNRNTWRAVQEECSDLRKLKTFKSQGTVPNKKSKNLRVVRRYISAGVLLAHDDVLVHPLATPLGPMVERIVIPYQVLHGLLTVLHLKLNHPTSLQLTKAFARYFFAINLEKAIMEVSRGCHQCAAIKEVPRAMIEESTEAPPSSVGGRFAADIIKRCSQKIFIIRESVTSYTLAEIIPDETTKTITDSLVKQCNILRPSSTSKITVRLDPAPAHQSMFKLLKANSQLSRNNIEVEIGRILNKNKNPVIDKGIKELHRELLILVPMGGPITSTQLSQATANLNCRYRRLGLSAHELWTQRDQITGEQLPINDRQVIIHQYEARRKNHIHSQTSKAFGKPFRATTHVEVGSLVYVHTDRSKTTARQRYLVTSICGNMVKLRKFTAQLFGTKEYDAKLQEIYKVPSFDDTILVDREDSSSDGDDPFLEEVSASQTRKESTTRIGLPEGNLQENNVMTSSSSESEERSSSGEYNEDTEHPVPQTMKRGSRIRKKPDRYGTWKS